jgi:hypothetical protein
MCAALQAQTVAGGSDDGNVYAEEVVEDEEGRGRFGSSRGGMNRN